MQTSRKILLVEPIFHVHTISYWEAALVSAGFEDAEFTLVTFVNDELRARAERWATGRERVRLHTVTRDYESLPNRLACWRACRKVMLYVETLLAAERFERVGYLFFDHALPFLSLGLLARQFPQHRAAGVSGLVFRDNGFRPSMGGFKSRLRAAMDRRLLALAARSPAVKKLAFLDSAAARNARSLLKSGPGSSARAAS
jgi:hypothetical protein